MFLTSTKHSSGEEKIFLFTLSALRLGFVIAKDENGELSNMPFTAVHQMITPRFSRNCQYGKKGTLCSCHPIRERMFNFEIGIFTSFFAGKINLLTPSVCAEYTQFNAKLNDAYIKVFNTMMIDPL